MAKFVTRRMFRSDWISYYARKLILFAQIPFVSIIMRIYARIGIFSGSIYQYCCIKSSIYAIEVDGGEFSDDFRFRHLGRPLSGFPPIVFLGGVAYNVRDGDRSAAFTESDPYAGNGMEIRISLSCDGEQMISCKSSNGKVPLSHVKDALRIWCSVFKNMEQ